jgi:general secretion pathway protein D
MKIQFIKFLILSSLLQFQFVQAESTESTESRSVSVDIRGFIATYAKQESKDILVDSRVKGNVTLFSQKTPTKITDDEFHLVLLTHGYGAYVEDDLIVVAQQVLTKQRNIPEYNGKSRGKLSAHQVVFTTIQVKHRDVESLAIVLRPLIEQWGLSQADEASNTLVVVTTLSNAERIHNLVKQLDKKADD